MSLVTDSTEREAFLNRLPGDRPEAQGGDENIAVFDFKFGNMTLRGAYYQLTREAINEGVTIAYRNKDGQLVLSLNTAAFYLEMLGADNQRVVQRLIGISDPVVDPATGNPTQDIAVTWFYDPFGFPKSEKSSAVQLTIPVLGYELPNGQGNPLNMWFIPLLGDGVVVPGYTPGSFLKVTGLYEGGVPEAFKVKATIRITPELGQVFKYFSQIGLTLSYEEEGDWSVKTENFGVQVPDTTLGDNALTIIIDTGIITIPLAEVPARLQTKDGKLLLLNSDGKQVLATFDPLRAADGWQKTPEIPDGWELFDLNQFPTLADFQRYVSESNCASYISLGGDSATFHLFAKEVSMPEDQIGQLQHYWMPLLDTKNNCFVFFYSPSGELPTGNRDAFWGMWQEELKIVYSVIDPNGQIKFKKFFLPKANK